MSTTSNFVVRCVDPRCPISKKQYGVQQFVAILLACALLGPLDSIGQRGWQISAIILVFLSTSVVLGAMVILALKRLLDVGWSRYWSLLIIGPVLMYSLLAIGRSDTVLLRSAIIPVGILFAAGCGLIVVLFLKTSRADGPGLTDAK